MIYESCFFFISLQNFIPKELGLELAKIPFRNVLLLSTMNDIANFSCNSTSTGKAKYCLAY